MVVWKIPIEKSRQQSGETLSSAINSINSCHLCCINSQNLYRDYLYVERGCECVKLTGHLNCPHIFPSIFFVRHCRERKVWLNSLSLVLIFYLEFSLSRFDFLFLFFFFHVKYCIQQPLHCSTTVRQLDSSFVLVWDKSVLCKGNQLASIGPTENKELDFCSARLDPVTVLNPNLPKFNLYIPQAYCIAINYIETLQH